MKDCICIKSVASTYRLREIEKNLVLSEDTNAARAAEGLSTDIYRCTLCQREHKVPSLKAKGFRCPDEALANRVRSGRY